MLEKNNRFWRTHLIWMKVRLDMKRVKVSAYVHKRSETSSICTQLYAILMSLSPRLYQYLNDDTYIFMNISLNINEFQIRISLVGQIWDLEGARILISYERQGSKSQCFLEGRHKRTLFDHHYMCLIILFIIIGIIHECSWIQKYL